MPGPADALADVLRGIAGSAPTPGRVHVVAVPRFDPGVTSVRAAVVVAGADVLRVPAELPPDVLSVLSSAPRTAGSLATLRAADVPHDRVLVQLVATAMQTAPAVVAEVARLRAEGVVVEVVASTGEVDAALVAAGVAPGVARTTEDGRLDVAVLAADRPDLDDWRAGLRARGHLDHTPAVLVTRAGTPHQRARAIAVRDLVELVVPGPVVLVVGDGVGGPASWRDDLPLAGITVANPRATHQATQLTARLRSLGAEVLHTPLLAVEPGDAAALQAAVHDLAQRSYELVALTSANGVTALADAVDAAGLDARVLGGVATVACVGPGTAQTLADRLSVRADLVAELHTAAGLADAIGPPPTPGARALLPLAAGASDVLRAQLASAGWDVTLVEAYRTVTRPLSEAATAVLASGDVDVVPVLSSSMGRALVEAGRKHGIRAALVSIGPVTTATLAELGVMPLVEADSSDLDGLVAAVEQAAVMLGGRGR